MLLYFSSEKNADIFNEEVKNLDIVLEIETEKYLTEYINKNMNKLNNLQFLAIDLENIIDDDIEIIKSISSFKLFNSSVNIIIVSFEREKGDILLGKLFAEGVYNFITSKDYDVRKTEIKMCLENPNNYANALGYKVENIENLKSTDKKLFFSNFINNIKNKPKEPKEFKNNSKKIIKNQTVEKCTIEKNKKINTLYKENIHIEFIQDTNIINYFGNFIGIIENGIAIIDVSFKLDIIENFCKQNNLKYIFKDGICKSLLEVKQSMEVKNIIEVEKKVLVKPKINKLKIAVCGTCSRMGATTQAFLIANYLVKYKFNTCYIEANGKNSLSNIKNFYEVSVDDKNKKISYKGLDIFANITLEDLPNILSMNYEVFVFDYGEFLNTFEESFASADIRIVVSGAKFWEEKYIRNVFKICNTYKDINFIFNFVDEDEQDFILKNMEGLKVYFSQYAPNIFKVYNEKIYKHILKNYLSFNEVT